MWSRHDSQRSCGCRSPGPLGTAVPAPTSSPIPAAAKRLDAPLTLAPDQCRSLLDDLAQLADPRCRRGRRHALGAVLAVAVARATATRGRPATGQPVPRPSAGLGLTMPRRHASLSVAPADVEHQQPGPATPVLANRPLRPGTDPAGLSRFTDGRWWLTPAIFEDHATGKSLNLAGVPEPFQQAAKHYVWQQLNHPTPPVLRGQVRSRLGVLTIAHNFQALAAFLHWLAACGIDRLCNVTARDLDAYLADLLVAPTTAPAASTKSAGCGPTVSSCLPQTGCPPRPHGRVTTARPSSAADGTVWRTARPASTPTRWTGCCAGHCASSRCSPTTSLPPTTSTPCLRGGPTGPAAAGNRPHRTGAGATCSAICVPYWRGCGPLARCCPARHSPMAAG